MVKIRLQRMGRKKRPEYRVVVADSRMPRDGRFIERIGVYYPQTPEGDKQVRIDMDRAKYWLGVGAQPSDTVRGLLHRVGVLEGRAPSRGKPNQPSKKQLEAEAKQAAAAQAETEAAAQAAADAAKQAAASQGGGGDPAVE